MSKLDAVKRNQLTLQRVSIHSFDRRGKGMRLRRSKMPITAQNVSSPASYQRLRDYLFDLVFEAIREDPRTRQALFAERGDGSVAALIDELYDHPKRFHATSEALAKALQAAINDAKLSGRAAAAARRSAYFLLVEFHAGDELCYAILRLDHDEHLEVRFSSGDQPPDLVVHDRDLPTANRLKDKLAVIVPPNQRLLYDLMVTDRKYDKRSARPIALYFLESYLGAQLISDPDFYTEVFIDTVRSFARRRRDELEESEVRFDRYFSGLEHSMNRKRLEVQDTLDDLLPDQPALREELRSDLHDRGVTTSNFEVSPQVSREKLSRRRLVLSNGIRISGDRQTMDRTMTIELEADLYQIELEAESFVES